MIDKAQLIREYAAMRARTEEAVKAARERKKEELKAEIAAIRMDHKIPFARRLLEAREAGMKRADLLEVIGTQSGDRLKELIELAGGSMRRLTTADERLEKMKQAEVQSTHELQTALGVTYTGMDDWGGTEYPFFTVAELDGEPFYLHRGAAWPTGGNQRALIEWSNEHKAEIAELAKHYGESGE